MKSLHPIAFALVCAVSSLPVAAQSDWDDIKTRLGISASDGEWHTAMNLHYPSTGQDYFSASNSVSIDEYQRAGVLNAPIADNSARITKLENAATDSAAQSAREVGQDKNISKNAENVDKNQTAIRSNRAHIQRNTSSIENNRLGIQQNQTDIRDLNSRVDRLDSKISSGIALLAALDFVRPLEGKTHRVGIGGGNFEGHSAVSVGLTSVFDEVDLSVGVGTTGEETLGKVSFGFSF